MKKVPLVTEDSSDDEILIGEEEAAAFANMEMPEHDQTLKDDMMSEDDVNVADDTMPDDISESENSDVEDEISGEI